MAYQPFKAFDVQIEPDIDAPIFTTAMARTDFGIAVTEYRSLTVALPCNPFAPFKRIMIGWFNGGGGTITWGDTPPPPATARNKPGTLTTFKTNRPITVFPILLRGFQTSEGNSTGLALGWNNAPTTIRDGTLNPMFVVPPWIDNQHLMTPAGFFNLSLAGNFDRIRFDAVVSGSFSGFQPAYGLLTLGLLEQQFPFSNS